MRVKSPVFQTSSVLRSLSVLDGEGLRVRLRFLMLVGVGSVESGMRTTERGEVNSVEGSMGERKKRK
jgi:hypothetical protein